MSVCNRIVTLNHSVHVRRIEIENLWNILIIHGLPNNEAQSGCVVLFPSFGKEYWKILPSTRKARDLPFRPLPHQRWKICPHGVLSEAFTYEWGRQPPRIFISSARDGWRFSHLVPSRQGGSTSLLSPSAGVTSVSKPVPPVGGCWGWFTGFALRAWSFSLEHSWPHSVELLLTGSWAVRTVQRGRFPLPARVPARNSGFPTQGPSSLTSHSRRGRSSLKKAPEGPNGPRQGLSGSTVDMPCGFISHWK